MLSNRNDLKKAAVNRTRVEYTKDTSRIGWKGCIVCYDPRLQRATIQYDDCYGGVVQEYHESAFIGIEKYIIEEGILDLYPDNAPFSYITTNEKGKVLCGHYTEEEAIEYSSTLVKESETRVEVRAYKLAFIASSPKPEVIIKDPDGAIIQKASEVTKVSKPAEAVYTPLVGDMCSYKYTKFGNPQYHNGNCEILAYFQGKVWINIIDLGPYVVLVDNIEFRQGTGLKW